MACRIKRCHTSEADNLIILLNGHRAYAIVVALAPDGAHRLAPAFIV